MSCVNRTFPDLTEQVRCPLDLRSNRRGSTKRYLSGFLYRWTRAQAQNIISNETAINKPLAIHKPFWPEIKMFF